MSKHHQVSLLIYSAFKCKRYSVWEWLRTCRGACNHSLASLACSNSFLFLSPLYRSATTPLPPRFTRSRSNNVSLSVFLTFVLFFPRKHPLRGYSLAHPVQLIYKSSQKNCRRFCFQGEKFILKVFIMVKLHILQDMITQIPAVFSMVQWQLLTGLPRVRSSCALNRQ